MSSFDFKTCQVGDVLPQDCSGPITNLRLVKWAAGSGDFNAIHFDLNIAKKQGLENVLVHGPFKHAIATSFFMNWLGNAGHIRKISATYTGMDIGGSSLRISGAVTGREQVDGKEHIRCDYELVNQEGKTTVKGKAVLVLD